MAAPARTDRLSSRPALVRGLGLGLVLMAMVGAAPAHAQTDPPPTDPKSTEQAIEDARRGLMRALDLILRAIPQYAAPEINENGDIIIRRIHPKPNKKDTLPPTTRDPDPTQT